MSSIKTCPACNYTRQVTDDAVPEWECPKCQKAYNKIAHTDQSQVSVVMAPSSSAYIRVSISGDNKPDSGSQIHFDGSQHVDPIAMKTKWTPANISRVGEMPPNLVKLSTNRIILSSRKSSLSLSLLSIFMGIVCVFNILHSPKPIANGKDVLALGFSLMFIVAGLFIIFRFGKPVVFDKLSGYFWKGGKAHDEMPDSNSVEDLTALENIHALQLISWQTYSTAGQGSRLLKLIELNLVLENSQRVNVAVYGTSAVVHLTSYSMEKNPREHAAILGKFLGKPVWDAID